MVPTVSIIVPVYNVEKYVLRCLESLAAQTLRDIEVIIVDDGSTDSSGAICEEFAKKDSRFRLFRQPNAGLAGARNTGLGLVRGKYVGFVDSDDLVEPDMYETLVSAAEEKGADIALCGRVMFWEDGREKEYFTLDGPAEFTAEEAVRRMLLGDGLDAAAWDKLYRAEMFEKVRYPGFYVSEDIPVTSELLSRANLVVHCGRPLYRYLQREGSLSHIGYEEKTVGVYLFHKDVGLRMAEKYPALGAVGKYFCYKGMLILLFRYAGAERPAKRPRQAFRFLRKNIISILRNPYLKRKYKIFALAACFGAERLAFRVGEKRGINASSL